MKERYNKSPSYISLIFQKGLKGLKRDIKLYRSNESPLMIKLLYENESIDVIKLGWKNESQ